MPAYMWVHLWGVDICWMGLIVWWEQSSCLASVVSCDPKTDVCASISVLSSAISSGLTCPGCHWITTGKSVSRMRVSLDYCIWTTRRCRSLRSRNS